MVESLDWITPATFEEVLKRNKTDEIIVLDVSLKLLPKSYTCKLYRVYVKYKINLEKEVITSSFIIKRKHEHITFAADFGMIQKELFIYKYGLPKLEAVIGEKLGPSTYLLNDDLMILQDLCSDNFHNSAACGIQLDYNHCKEVIKRIAKFHAASVVVYEQEPRLVNKFGEEVFYKKELHGKFHSVVEDALQVLAEEISTWPESKQFTQAIVNMKNEIWQLLTRYSNCFGKVCVLNHGDLSSNNILFKYDPINVVDIRFIDFQCCRYTTPVMDLQFFLCTSVDINVIQDHLSDILDLYLNTFNGTLLEQSNQNILVKSDFELEFNNADFVGLYAASICLPQFLANEEEIECLKGVNFDEFKNSCKNPIFKLMKSPKYRVVMPKILEYFYNRQLFTV
uniref:CHK kinase-like domain-containing protein n=1 Tax=Clastoptera arizonana TaxID=38151 RepID=A0A1B6DII6_9HEMI